MNSGCGSQRAEFPRRALANVLTTVNYPVTFIQDVNLVTREALQGVSLFIQSGSVDTITPETEQVLLEFVQNGGAFLALHNASASPRRGQHGHYEQLVGGAFLKHPPPYHIMMHVTDAGRKHPVMAGVQDFEIYDEHHYVRYDVDPMPAGQRGPARLSDQEQAGPPRYSLADLRSAFNTRGAHVLLTGYAMDNEMDSARALLGDNGVSQLVAGWWQEIGKGRMVFFSPGHTAEVMNHPMMQRLYQNAVRWLVREK
jgi:type 1 glutamine amidotransferase